MSARRAASLLILATTHQSSWAENLIYNHDFSLGEVAWHHTEPPPTTIEIVDEDASGNPGSWAISSTLVAPDSSATIFQCTEGVFGGLTYDFGARIRVPAGQAGTGAAAVLLQFYPNTSCFFEPIEDAVNSPIVGDETAGFWTPSYHSVTAPEGALSAVVVIGANRISGTSHTVIFDGVIVALQGTEALPLFVDGFEQEGTSAWSSTVP